ncbi:M48 family metallopeptidase [Massilia sp. W12]|uniref:M48 family metallopeptidase n=1 Tax=Massilia sp. W12 TaxID=3126507 RepID=UPI0030D2DC87
MSRFSPAPVLLALLALAGCNTPPPAPPQEAPQQGTPAQTVTAPPQASPAAESLKALVAQQDRLDRIAAPLLLKNAELCRSQARNLLGFTAKNRYSYSSEFVQAAQEVYGLHDQLQIMSVLGGSGAALAGIKRGDVLLKIEGRELPQGMNAERIAATILAPLVTGKTRVNLTIQRDGETLQVQAPLTRACGMRVELGNADNVATYGDGARVMVTRGMLAFTRSDEEVAYLIAREMAHNALGHPGRIRGNSAITAMIDNLLQIKPDTSLLITNGGIKPYPADLDAQADYLAIFLLVRAGYPIGNARFFWSRLAEAHPATRIPDHTALHPNLAARLSALDKAAGDVRTKQAQKKPLTP